MRMKLILLLILCISLSGQSAYYRLGYGDLFPSTDPMGSGAGTGVIALQDSALINMHNPATLNNLKRVYFGGYLGSEYRSVSETMSNNTRLEQVSFALPLGNKIGMSLGALAVSDFESIYGIELDDGEITEKSSGGIWDYQLGLGYTLNPTMSLGIKLHSLRGQFRRQTMLISDTHAELYVLKGTIHGKSLELGMISQLGQKVTLGVTADIVTQIPILEGRDSLAGTAEYVEFSEKLAAWPTTIKLGVVYHYSDYTKIVTGIAQQLFPENGFQDASVFSLPDGWHTVPVASFQSSLLHLATDRNSRQWTKRTSWQAGVSFKNYYLSSSSNKLFYELAFISGIRLGLRTGKSLFEVSGEFGSRSGDESLPEELYARIKFGIQVNDTWFKKVKRR
ncbi:hypothetical protein HQ531_09700 [bacterium]|nr:hypothetical protein [bacterium]